MDSMSSKNVLDKYKFIENILSSKIVKLLLFLFTFFVIFKLLDYIFVFFNITHEIGTTFFIWFTIIFFWFVVLPLKSSYLIDSSQQQQNDQSPGGGGGGAPTKWRLQQAQI